MDVRTFWLAGRAATGDTELTVTNPHDGREVARHSVPTDAQVEEAVAAAHAVAREAAALPVHVRAEALAHVSRRIAERAEEIAQLITAENGKPIVWARGEVGRAVATFRLPEPPPAPPPPQPAANRTAAATIVSIRFTL
ncbi:aldehyde dehydrogenase family protein, partial [Nonomuraea fuscirosea]